VRVDRPRAEHLPVARVAVDVPLAHLDRPFDYLVAEADSPAAQPGVRVRVRFSGRLVDGFVLQRVAESEHEGRLAFLDRVVSPEVVLTEPVAALCRLVADRYAGTMADVLRLAVPPRHGRTEAEPPRGLPADGAGSEAGGAERGPDAGLAASGAEPGTDVPAGGDAGWAAYPAGRSFIGAVAAGRAPRAVWQALPGEDWAARFAEAAAAAQAADRGALLLVADARDLARLQESLGAALPPGAFETLAADLGPAERYRRFLAVSRGTCRVVAGTRAAAFAPVRDLGLVALFDDGDDLFAEPRAPYPHAREILLLRAARERAAVLIGGFARTAESQLLVESGWAKPIVADRATARRRAARIEAAGDSYAVGADSAAARARLTPAAFAAARQALQVDAPVLIQVPRSGYQPSLACADCGRAARCRRCSGPLAVPRAARTPVCRWCGMAVPRWVCAACAGSRLRVAVTGAARTAEEVGRAFPGALLRTSMAGKVLERVPAGAALVVATPGAEPIADGGYGAGLLLDGALLLGRPDLRAAEETVRRWMAAATLVRPAAAGGRVVVGADPSLAAVQALVRWDPATFAAMELAERRELGFPPAVAMASIEGGEASVGAVITELTATGSGLPASALVLGPVPVPVRGKGDAHSAPAGISGEGPDGGAADPAEPRVRAFVRVDPPDRKALAGALRVLAASRSLRKDLHPLRVEIDPVDLG
jgi:primosomal protein N' (replication factor Y)